MRASNKLQQQMLSSGDVVVTRITRPVPPPEPGQPHGAPAVRLWMVQADGSLRELVEAEAEG